MTDIFNTLLTSNTLNFLVVAAIIIYLCFKLNVVKSIENLRSDIKSFVDESDKEKNDAENSLSAAEKNVEKLPSDIDAIKSDTQRSVINLSEKYSTDTEKQKFDIYNNSQRILNLEIKDFKKKLSDLVSLKSVEKARQNAINQLKHNKELHDLYIQNAIKEIEGADL